MAEFCLDCWNEMNGTHYTPDQVVLEEDLFDTEPSRFPQVRVLETVLNGNTVYRA